MNELLNAIATNLNETDVSSGFENCLRETHQWGNTMITNICSSNIYNIPMGFFDYMAVAAVIVTIVLLAGVIIYEFFNF